MKLTHQDFQEFYKRYRLALENLEYSERLADFNWYSLDGVESHAWFIYDLMLTEFAISLGNAVNQLVDYSFRLKAWDVVLSEVEDEIAMELGFEFVDPIVTIALNSPYSIKQRFIFAVTHLCHQANRLKLGSSWRDDLPNDKNISKSVMQERGVNWSGFARFVTELEKLFSRDHEARTASFRVNYNHRTLNKQTIGHTAYIRRVKGQKGVQYTLSQQPPFQLGQLSEEILKEGEQAVIVFNHFKDLILEQIAEIKT